MKKLLATIIVLFILPITSFGQVIVGSYHMAATGKDYVVVVDDMQSRHKRRAVKRQLKKCQIYLQVESNTPDVEAYIELSSGSVNDFIKDLNKRFNQRYYRGIRVKVGDDDVDLYMKYRNVAGNDIYGYESGQDFDIYYERNEEYQVLLTYFGESAKSEGVDGISISGWKLIITDEDEIRAIDELLRKAQTMIKNNRAES